MGVLPELLDVKTLDGRDFKCAVQLPPSTGFFDPVSVSSIAKCFKIISHVEARSVVK